MHTISVSGFLDPPALFHISFFFLTLFSFFLLMFPSVLARSPLCRLFLFSFNAPSLHLPLSPCLSCLPPLALCCLNKVAFIRMSRNPNKANKRYGRGNLPAEEGGSYRASHCVPVCQLPTPPPRYCRPLPTHTHTQTLVLSAPTPHARPSVRDST